MKFTNKMFNWANRLSILAVIGQLLVQVHRSVYYVFITYYYS